MQRTGKGISTYYEEKISKKTGILLFYIAALIMACLIVFHKNPNAQAAEENLKRLFPLW